MGTTHKKFTHREGFKQEENPRYKYLDGCKKKSFFKPIMKRTGRKKK